MTLRAYKIPPLVLLTTVMALAVGELACGTSLYFVAMMMIALLSIGVTYNLYGGLSTLSGICFANLGLQTIVISQFAKVVLFEAADKNLEAPFLTITIYAVFYFFAMLGALLFAGVRISAPKPVEPVTYSQADRMYLVAIILGFPAVVMYEVYTTAYSVGTTQFGIGHSLAIAGSPLLLFSIVLAVDTRIRKSGYKHSLGFRAVVPMLTLMLAGFVDTVRLVMATPIIAYFFTCYVRGYRFRRRHYASAVVLGLLFVLFISPLELFTRDFVRQLSLRDRAYVAFHTLLYNSSPQKLIANQESQLEDRGALREQYFNRPGTYLLSRFSLIRSDSNVISACSQGFHYGFTAIMIELRKSIPTLIDPNKPRYISGQDYIGHVSGMSADNTYVSYPQISAVGDSYGAFGWIGVVCFPLFCIPLLLAAFESVFDISRPWGTVALGLCFAEMSALMLDAYVPLLVRTPLTLLFTSMLLGWIVRLLPARERRLRSDAIGIRA